MADDIVAAARDELTVAIKRLNGCDDSMYAACWVAIDRAVDALIAAVRAEHRWHCAVCGGTLSCEECSRGIVSHDMLG